MIELTIGSFHLGIPLLELGAFLTLLLAGFRWAWHSGSSHWETLRSMTHLSEGATHEEILEAIKKRLSQ